MKTLVAGGIVTLALVVALSPNQAGEKKAEPKYKISEVMKKGMKGGLAKKVAEGKATEAEKQELVDMFVSMHAHLPSRGERSAWEKMTTSLVEAARASQKGDEQAGKQLAKLINCSACHKEFKGK